MTCQKLVNYIPEHSRNVNIPPSSKKAKMNSPFAWLQERLGLSSRKKGLAPSEPHLLYQEVFHFT